MKRKLLSVVSVVLAMSMTTSAFAATARGTGDVDDDGKYTANDVFAILTGKYTGLVGADEANVANNANGVKGADANVLYNTILQPRYVSEALALRVYTENYSIGANPIDVIEGVDDFGSKSVTNDYGTKIVANEGALAENVTGTTTIKGVLDKLVGIKAVDLDGDGDLTPGVEYDGLLNDATASRITDQLEKISFKDAKGNPVALRSEGGWAKLCWALKPIIPLTERDAEIVNRPDEVSSEAEISEKKDRVDALENVRTIVVGDQELTLQDLVTIKNEFLKAFPNDITEDEVRKTVARVLTITDQKYEFSASYNNVDDIISSSAVEVGDVTDPDDDTYAGDGFVKLVCDFIGNYQNKTIADLRSTFGDKIAISSQRTDVAADKISAVIEVVVKASYNPESGEGTTTAPSETTTTVEPSSETTTVEESSSETTTVEESSSETTTVETPSEGGFNYAPEATAEAGVKVVDNGSVTIETVQKMDYKALSGTDTVNGKEYTSYAQSSGVNTKITTDDEKTATYRLAYKITAKADTTVYVDHKVTSGKANYILKDVVITGQNDKGQDVGTATVVDMLDNVAGSSSVYDTFTIELKAGETIWVAGQGSNICVYAIYA